MLWFLLFLDDLMVSNLMRLLQFFVPPTLPDAEETQNVRPIYIYLEVVGLFFFIITPILAGAAKSPERKLSVWLFDGGWVLLTPLFMWLVRRNKIKLFKGLYIFLMWGMTFYFILRFYDNLLATVLLFLGVMMIAGHIAGVRGLLIVGVAGLVGQLFKIWALLEGWFLPAVAWRQVRADGIFSLFIFFLLGSLLWNLTYNLSLTLERSHTNAGLLRAKNELLVVEIAERQQISVALEVSEQNYRQLLEQAADAIFLINQEGHVVLANAAGSDLLGYSMDELVGLSVKEALMPEVLHLLPARMEEMRSGKSFIVERVLRRKDGTFVEVEINSKILSSGLYQAIVRDITVRKQTEAILKRSEALRRVTNEIAKMGGWELDLQTHELYWTDTVREIHEVPPDYVPELENAFHFYVPEYVPLIRNAIEQATTGKAYDLELQMVTAAQKRLWVRVIGRPVWEEGQVVKLQGVFQDITERKQAEVQILTSLQEKEILLKEVHHRVKNNLQVISSLLYLQSLEIEDERMLELFRESQTRVSAMALVHEQLYQSENFACVDFGIYLRTLVGSLFEAYGALKMEIALSIETDGTTLDVHTAIPCGLLVSEMVSNALKYAFPEGKGRITITLCGDGSENLLQVRDDGVGFPENSAIRSRAVGVQLIDRLAAQLGGTLTRGGPPGTVYTLRFPA